MFAFARSLLLLLALLAAAGNASAQAYPSRPIRILVPALPGDSCDILSRLIGQKMGERLGQQLVVDNRPGASGTIGLAMAAQATPDGYTLACGQGGNMSVIPHSMKDVPYDALKDFSAVALFATNYLALVVNPNLPIKTVDDLIRYARANPGKVSFASNGEGAFLHFAAELFRTQAGITYLHVPFKGVAQMATELMGGRVDAAFSSFTGVYPYVKGGRLRLLGIARLKRVENYPDVPAIAETLPGFDVSSWIGLALPTGTPADIVKKSSDVILEAAKDPAVVEKMKTIGAVANVKNPEEFRAFMQADYEKWQRVIKANGISVD